MERCTHPNIDYHPPPSVRMKWKKSLQCTMLLTENMKLMEKTGEEEKRSSLNFWRS